MCHRSSAHFDPLFFDIIHRTWVLQTVFAPLCYVHDCLTILFGKFEHCTRHYRASVDKALYIGLALQEYRKLITYRKKAINTKPWLGFIPKWIDLHIRAKKRYMASIAIGE